MKEKNGKILLRESKKSAKLLSVSFYRIWNVRAGEVVVEADRLSNQIFLRFSALEDLHEIQDSEYGLGTHVRSNRRLTGPRGKNPIHN
jgi:hypothetical protein